MQRRELLIATAACSSVRPCASAGLPQGRRDDSVCRAVPARRPIAHVKSGKLRALAVASSARHLLVPDVPTTTCASSPWPRSRCRAPTPTPPPTCARRSMRCTVASSATWRGSKRGTARRSPGILRPRPRAQRGGQDRAAALMVPVSDCRTRCSRPGVPFESRSIPSRAHPASAAARPATIPRPPAASTPRPPASCR